MTLLRELVVLLACATVAMVATAGQPRDLPSLDRALDDALRTYDTAAATAVLSEARVARGSSNSRPLAQLHARAALAVAELLRVELEQLAATEAEQRRLLGLRIDAAAEDGLQALEVLPETSEVQRMRADLIATMIRSDFRAKKYEQPFRAAVARALELDQGNARAWVSSSKPYLFAEPEQGGDVAEALRRLERALELDPRLESARLLRALAHDKAGDLAAAERDWQAALRANPQCRPARDRLHQEP
jgi:tetratricopeptide (TPR) repeat protein